MSPPTISPAGGYFKYAQTITISDLTAGASIFYTLDGSTPTSASTRYTAPFSLDAEQEVNAIAISDGSSSMVATETFSFNEITGVISTVAGDGKATYNGENVNAIFAALNHPAAVASDSQGDLFIADQFNQRIRKVDSSGAITTVAGTGTGGYNGDGQPATNAELNDPVGIAVDSAGNLYIVDVGNQRIRKVSTDGTISTIAGTGNVGPNGDGGQATSAELFYPSGVAVDGEGNVFVADSGNDRVRKIDSSGIITTVAGTGGAGYSGDGGAATAALLWNPTAVAVDDAGNLYITDNYNNAVREVNTSGQISTISSPSYEPLNNPGGLAVDNVGHLLYLADTNNSRVLVMTSDGDWTVCAGRPGNDGYAGDGGDSGSAMLSLVEGVSVDSSGNLYIADTLNNRIRKVTFGVPDN